MAKSLDSAVRQIYFDKLVEMGRLPSNPTDQTIQTINEIPEADVLKLLRSLPGTGPTIQKAGGGIMDINEMTRPVGYEKGGMALGERIAKIKSNLASTRFDRNAFFNLIKQAGYVKKDGSADIKAFNKAAEKIGIDTKDRSARNLARITKFLNKISGGAYKNVGMFSAKSLAENAASRSEGFLGQYAEKYSAATKEEFWDDAIKTQRKVNKLKIPSADKVKEIARSLKLKWAVPIGTTATLLTKVGFGKALPGLDLLIPTEMGSGELPKEGTPEYKELMKGLMQGEPEITINAEDALADQKKQNMRGGGMMNMDEMIRPLGYKHGGLHEEDNRLPGNLNKAELFALARANTKKEQNEILPGNLNRTELKLLQETKPEKTGMLSGLMSLIKNIRENAFAPEQREDGGAEYNKIFNFLWKQGFDAQQIDDIINRRVNQEDLVPTHDGSEEFKG